MASSGHTTPKLSVDDILTFSDAELTKYMQENRHGDGSFNLQFDGWKDLPKDQRDNLAQRLRTGAQAAKDMAQSRPVDFDQVAARLLEVSADDKEISGQPRPQPQRRARSRTGLPDHDYAKKFNIVCYDGLVSDGGRPSYPISLIDQVSENPEEYLEWDITRKQSKRWKDFRRWQRDNRGIYDYDRERLAHTEMRRSQAARLGHTEVAAELEANPLYYAFEWDVMERLRQEDHYWLREDHGHGEFLEYAEEVKHRLAKHGFTQTFQLEEDPKRQDNLTTWIEYLNYEYSEETSARKDVASAETAVNAAMAETEKDVINPQRSDFTTKERSRRLEVAQSRLNAAKRTLKALERRNYLIGCYYSDTQSYMEEKTNEYRQTLLLKRTLQQLPLIEAELNESRKAENNGAMQQPPARQVKGSSHKTRSGRISKKMSQTQNARGIRSQQSTPARVGALPTCRKHSPDMLEESSDNEQGTHRSRRTQRRTYEKTRASRRLAGQPPEFSTQPGRSDTQRAREASLQPLQGTGKSSSSAPRSSRLSKTAVKSAKLRGISKYTRKGR
ncbi:hypothetical protein F5X99DRAFT_432308 [Biscogniauxia marginata]|nr:hypothetical protein F5X99DRAFT_432308 [Biscogniauxia marginata]